jgi:hypothetical protein
MSENSNMVSSLDSTNCEGEKMDQIQSQEFVSNELELAKASGSKSSSGGPQIESPDCSLLKVNFLQLIADSHPIVGVLTPIVISVQTYSVCSGQEACQR